jgi:hypothetical protein
MGFWADIQKEASQNSAISSNVVCLRLMFVTQFQFAGNYPDYRHPPRKAMASFFRKTPQLYRRRRVTVCLSLERDGSNHHDSSRCEVACSLIYICPLISCGKCRTCYNSGTRIVPPRNTAASVSIQSAVTTLDSLLGWRISKWRVRDPCTGDGAQFWLPFVLWF